MTVVVWYYRNALQWCKLPSYDHHHHPHQGPHIIIIVGHVGHTCFIVQALILGQCNNTKVLLIIATLIITVNHHFIIIIITFIITITIIIMIMNYSRT